MSKNEISKKLKIGSLAGGLAFGGLSFCGLNDVDADVVAWATPGSVTVGVGSNIQFDIDGDGQNDFGAINQTYGQFLSVGFPGVGARIRTNGAVGGTYGNQPAGFNTGLGTYVISGGNTNSNSFGYLADAAGNVGPDFQGASPVTRNYAFDFIDGAGTELFAWGTIEYNGFGQSFDIISGYYEDAGGSIIVGETAAVPEPSSLMLLGLGAAGLAGFRRKRSA